MTKLEKLIEQLNDCNNVKEKTISLINKEYKKVFDKDKKLQKAIKDVLNSTDYCLGDGEIYSWIRCTEIKKFEDNPLIKDAFWEYCLDQGVDPDFDHDALRFNLGPSLIITYEGNIYDEDAGKFIAERDDYRDSTGKVSEVKRNALIEAYMEEKGYFPGVFSIDYYENVSMVDTKPKKSKKRKSQK